MILFKSTVLTDKIDSIKMESTSRSWVTNWSWSRMVVHLHGWSRNDRLFKCSFAGGMNSKNWSRNIG